MDEPNEARSDEKHPSEAERTANEQDTGSHIDHEEPDDKPLTGEGPESKPNDSVRKLGRNALIVALVSLALHPFSIWVGYVINQRLKAPQGSIEYLIPTIYTDTPEPTKEVVAAAREPASHDGVALDN
jgi:hypothetical protein